MNYLRLLRYYCKLLHRYVTFLLIENTQYECSTSKSRPFAKRWPNHSMVQIRDRLLGLLQDQELHNRQKI